MAQRSIHRAGKLSFPVQTFVRGCIVVGFLTVVTGAASGSDIALLEDWMVRLPPEHKTRVQEVLDTMDSWKVQLEDTARDLPAVMERIFCTTEAAAGEMEDPQVCEIGSGIETGRIMERYERALEGLKASERTLFDIIKEHPPVPGTRIYTNLIEYLENLYTERGADLTEFRSFTARLREYPVTEQNRARIIEYLALVHPEGRVLSNEAPDLQRLRFRYRAAVEDWQFRFLATYQADQGQRILEDQQRAVGSLDPGAMAPDDTDLSAMVSRVVRDVPRQVQIREDIEALSSRVVSVLGTGGVTAVSGLDDEDRDVLSRFIALVAESRSLSTQSLSAGSSYAEHRYARTPASMSIGATVFSDLSELQRFHLSKRLGLPWETVIISGVRFEAGRFHRGMRSDEANLIRLGYIENATAVLDGLEERFSRHRRVEQEDRWALLTVQANRTAQHLLRTDPSYTAVRERFEDYIRETRISLDRDATALITRYDQTPGRCEFLDALPDYLLGAPYDRTIRFSCQPEDATPDLETASVFYADAFFQATGADVSERSASLERTDWMLAHGHIVVPFCGYTPGESLAVTPEIRSGAATVLNQYAGPPPGFHTVGDRFQEADALARRVLRADGAGRVVLEGVLPARFGTLQSGLPVPLQRTLGVLDDLRAFRIGYETAESEIEIYLGGEPTDAFIEAVSGFVQFGVRRREESHRRSRVEEQVLVLSYLAQRIEDPAEFTDLARKRIIEGFIRGDLDRKDLEFLQNLAQRLGRDIKAGTEFSEKES
jgi:hypothetical protein